MGEMACVMEDDVNNNLTNPGNAAAPKILNKYRFRLEV